ncbi:hypothetical protein [Hymenobacter nivis]|uniref:Uncharacterized protein n=1 Tax=Hymenobacter nivis TaxID=1850093 RepID=A0A502GMT4_9BACT|nr:hypothetical protein [Hymenobacter nivis]TPG62296.1 hypothetical protein EAH73_19040 [Hymenobacter nivis]
MKTLGKLFLLLSFVVIGRWSRPNPPVIVTTFGELTAPANQRAAANRAPVLLVRHTEPAGSQQAAFSSALALF